MENIVSFIGAFLKHIIGVLLLCWRRMLRAGLVAFAIGVILVLLIAVISTGQAFPGALALAVALIFGGALAYGVALTVFIEELLLGVVDLIRLLEGDAKSVAHLTEAVAEREAGDVVQGLRRLIGLPLSKRAARTSPTPPPTLPILPTLPRNPVARPAARPASAPGARVAPSAAPTPRREALARDAAIAGASALASAAVAGVAHHQPVPPSSAQTQAQTAATPPANSAPAATSGGQTAPQERMGAPVRADHLPRIGWTYEHEAIRPVRVAEQPDTLAELADVAVTGAGIAGATRVASATEPEPHAPTESAAPEASTPEPADALDVAVVSATALGPYGQAADPATIATISTSATVNDTRDAPQNAATEDASEASGVSGVSDDAPALEDERLAEPVALAIPDEPPSVEPPSDEPLAPASVAENVDAETLAPAAPPLAQESQTAPAEAEPVDAEMLAPAPATTPLPADAPPLDPVKLTPAPATVPLTQEEEPAPQADVAPVAEPFAAAPMDAAPDAPPESDAEANAEVTALEQPPEPEAPTDADEPAADPGATQPEIPSTRSAFSRITRPVVDIGSTLDALHRVQRSSGPRASAPESGLWERLSQALIDRSGAPSSPFAAPQNRSASPDDHTTSEDDETPQA